MTFSQNYFPTHTGMPPVRIECVVIPMLLGTDEKTPGYSFEFKVLVDGGLASQGKGTVATESKDEATGIAYARVIDALTAERKAHGGVGPILTPTAFAAASEVRRDKSPPNTAPVELQCVITKRIKNDAFHGWDYNITVQLVHAGETRAISGLIDVVDEDRARVLVYMKMIELMGTWLVDLAPSITTEDP